MVTYREAWELDAMVKRIEDLERRIAERESDYDADDFEYITEYLSRAKKALHKAWLII